MANRILFIIALLGLLAGTSLSAQEESQKNRITEKIKGTRHIPYASYSGSPYLNTNFSIGEIEFTGGTKVKNIGLRYSCYRDEIIYFNSSVSAQIVIDKVSLRGFTFVDEEGVMRIFRRQYYDGFLKGDRYFEVLSDGDISLLAYRKVVLQFCQTYTDKSGKLKNMSYQQEYTYYIYNSKKGYEPIRINRNSLLSKFDKPTQKQVKKILRKNSVQITGEASFVRAWNLLKENGLIINF
jgi:hypothetical protein